MASIVKRGERFSVVYTYMGPDGKKKQKWESFRTEADAMKRKSEIEYRQDIESFTMPGCETLEDLLHEYVSLYGKTKWSISMYSSTTAIINNYIIPVIGGMKLRELTPRVIEKYYQKLLMMPAVPKCTDKKRSRKRSFVTPGTVTRIHRVLRSCFNQAVKWELMDRNPAALATVPKAPQEKREIWDAQTLFHAIEVCDDMRLKLAMNLAFACSLRIGELLGLTWNTVDISPESIENGTASIYINKELQRIDKKAGAELNDKDVLLSFPETGNSPHKTALVLKKPKTESSIRRVYLPLSVTKLLIECRKEQDELKEALGREYTDYGLVMAGPFGLPTESSYIRKGFNRLIEEEGLPKVVFHSLRHSSITYKLKLNGGDIKAVQGDSGHSQAKMITDQYSHILDDSRRENAMLLEEAFYGGKGLVNVKKESPAPVSLEEVPLTGSGTESDFEALSKLLRNPEIASLLKTLAGAAG